MRTNAVRLNRNTCRAVVVPNVSGLPRSIRYIVSDFRTDNKEIVHVRALRSLPGSLAPTVGTSNLSPRITMYAHVFRNGARCCLMGCSLASRTVHVGSTTSLRLCGPVSNAVVRRGNTYPTYFLLPPLGSYRFLPGKAVRSMGEAPLRRDVFSAGRGVLCHTAITSS